MDLKILEANKLKFFSASGFRSEVFYWWGLRRKPRGDTEKNLLNTGGFKIYNSVILLNYSF